MARLFGNDDDNRLTGSNVADLIYGRSGDDALYGFRGNDTIDGGEGNDRIWAGEGANRVSGGSGNDRIWAGAGSDVIAAGEGNDIVAAGRVDGVILIGQSDQTATIEAVARRFVPLVVWGAHRPDMVQVTVGTDNRAGGALAARHLTAIGRRRLAFLGDPGVPEFADRHAGFRAVIDATPGLTQTVLPLHQTARDAYDEAARFLASSPPPDGIFAASDVIAMSAMRAAADRGLRVPHDIAVVGFDDIGVAAHVVPPLTTIRQDVQRGARTLVELLVRRIAGEPAASVTMPPELILRSSA